MNIFRQFDNFVEERSEDDKWDDISALRLDDTELGVSSKEQGKQGRRKDKCQGGYGLCLNSYFFKTLKF